jgi:hypothetical protein
MATTRSQSKSQQTGGASQTQIAGLYRDWQGLRQGFTKRMDSIDNRFQSLGIDTGAQGAQATTRGSGNNKKRRAGGGRSRNQQQADTVD